MTEKNEPKAWAPRHRGPDHSSPYPVSRLAPAFHGGELAEQVAKAEADAVCTHRGQAPGHRGSDEGTPAGGAQGPGGGPRGAGPDPGPVRLQAHYRQDLPSHRKPDGQTFFSMLSPADWGGRPPQEHLGSYRLEADYSWTSGDRAWTRMRPASWSTNCSESVAYPRAASEHPPAARAVARSVMSGAALNGHAHIHTCPDSAGLVQRQTHPRDLKLIAKNRCTSLRQGLDEAEAAPRDELG